MGWTFHFKEVTSFSERDEKKSNMLQTSLFSYYFYKKNHTNFGNLFKFFLNGVKKKKKNYWLMVAKFLDPINVLNFH